MRRWLFLRSAHAEGLDGEGPDPILSIRDDMWCALFAEIVRQDEGIGQIWKLGTDHWETDREYPWMTCFRAGDLSRAADFAPDVIFNRGGYSVYDEGIVSARSVAPKLIYYGAGIRTLPGVSSIIYDLVLVDSESQEIEGLRAFDHTEVELIHKPASPTFTPCRSEKEFDIVFSSRRAVAFKGHKWLCDRLPKGTRVLRIGDIDPWFKLAEADRRLEVTWAGRMHAWNIPMLACKAKMAAVVDDGTKDSGPRVLPEYLAMNIPVIVRDTVRCDLNAYVTEQTGIVVGDEDFGEAYGKAIVRTDWAPREHYDQHFTMEHAAKEILSYVG